MSNVHAVVDPKPVQGQAPTAKGRAGGKANGSTGELFAGQSAPAPKAKSKSGKRPSVGGETPIPEDWAPNEGHYALALEKYGFQKRHVDFLAEEMRDKCEADGVVQVNWDAKFRTWMTNHWKWNNGKPPVLPAPPEPKRPMPPAPPMAPDVAAAAERARLRMEAGEKIDLKALFQVGLRLPPLENDLDHGAVGT